MKAKTFNFLLMFVLGFVSFSTYAQFPGCPEVAATDEQGLADATNTVRLDCGTSCVDLIAHPFKVGETTSYTVSSIPHTPPIPYNQAGGTAVSVNTDDVWSAAIDMPFNFCFFGETYTKFEIGSNGSIRFGSVSGGFHDWSFSASLPSSTLADRGQIMGVYHDIDPSKGGSIKWFLLGTAPCRIFCIVYNAVPHFSCNSIKSTSMIVLYETTNAIDVYVQSKPTCTSWNGGHAIIGIQNPNDWTDAYVAPGRNSSPNWTVTTPEAWRFNPSGNNIYTLEWLKDGQHISDQDTIHVCVQDSSVYQINATYTKCDGTTVLATDYITVVPPVGAPKMQLNTTPPTCGNSDGSVTIVATDGEPPYQYSTDGVNFSSTNTFTNLGNNTYTFYVKDNVGCVIQQDVNFSSTAINFAVDTTIQPKCYGGTDGSITLNVTGGLGALNISMDGGTSQTNQTFTGVNAGTHTFIVTDQAGCTMTQNVTVTQPDSLSINLNVVPSVCMAHNGEVHVTGVGGTPGYSYNFNGMNSTTGDYTALDNGSYPFIMTDANGCTYNRSITVTVASMVTNAPQTTPATCFGMSDGQVALNTTGGTPPYTYQINGFATQGPTITDLPAATYLITTTDVNGCTRTDTVIIGQPQELTVTVDGNTSVCVNNPTTLTATVSGGNGNYQYAWTPNNETTSSVSVNTANYGNYNYTVTVTDAKGCVDSVVTQMQILPYPIVSISPDSSEIYRDDTLSFTNGSQYANSYTWDFGDGSTITASSAIGESHSYTADGEYNVVLTASNGTCSSTATAYVKVLPKPDPIVFVPNVFTPNGDGANDTWKITFTYVQKLEVTILNRWGNVMKVLNTPNDSWDGNSKNSKADTGVYFYKYEIEDLNGKNHVGQGYFHLKR